MFHELSPRNREMNRIFDGRCLAVLLPTKIFPRKKFMCFASSVAVHPQQRKWRQCHGGIRHVVGHTNVRLSGVSNDVMFVQSFVWKLANWFKIQSGNTDIYTHTHRIW